MSWRVPDWWKDPEYKGQHREKLNSYTMQHMIEYHGVPRRRQPTYFEPEAREEQPVSG